MATNPPARAAPRSTNTTPRTTTKPAAQPARPCPAPCRRKPPPTHYPATPELTRSCPPRRRPRVLNPWPPRPCSAALLLQSCWCSCGGCNERTHISDHVARHLRVEPRFLCNRDAGLRGVGEPFLRCLAG